MARLLPSSNIDRRSGRHGIRLTGPAAWLLLLLAATSPPLPASASDATACAAGQANGRHCSSLTRRRLIRRLGPRLASRALEIPQLPASASPRFAPYAAAPAGRCRPRKHCAAITPEAGLPEALLVPPNPDTAPLLARLGIPVIAGVPPIVILDGRSRSPFDDPAWLHRKDASP